MLSLVLCLLAAVGLGRQAEPKELEWFEVPGEAGERLLVQAFDEEPVRLTVNESFFPRLGLRAGGTGATPDGSRRLNGGRSFAWIGRWDAGDRAHFGLWLESTGSIEARVFFSRTSAPCRFALRCGDAEARFTPRRRGEEPGLAATLELEVARAGRVELVLECLEDAVEDSEEGPRVHGIELSGAATRGAKLIRQRWRPAAAHARFSSSTAPEDCWTWIIEQDAAPGELGFYSPITTPFGYFGPSWEASGVVGTGLNFSLWSYGRGKPEPPLEELSHLLAVGAPDARFDGFGHEGTGVKIRGWKPFEGRQGQRQVLALRVEPGEPYDTYTSYFFDGRERRWRLFGVGRKFSRRPLRGLRVGTFVEVPGPPDRQRTGTIERRMRYRGWLVDGEGTLHALDRMSFGDVDEASGTTPTRRGVTEDGRFFLQAGGWGFREARGGRKDWLETEPDREGVDFLDDDDLSFLRRVPSAIEGLAIERTPQGARVTFTIEGLGKEASACAFWGEAEGLTFTDRWAHERQLEDVGEGRGELLLEGHPPDRPLSVRFLLRNHEGQFWSSETLTHDP